MKRVLQIVAVIVGLFAVLFYVVLGPMVFGNLPMVQGEQVAPGVTQIVDGYVSVFAIDAGDGAVVLIDAGNDASGAAILGWLKEKGLEPSAVRAILLTHGHPDHIAGAHLFPAAQVHAFPGDAAIVSGEGRAKGPLPKLMDTPVEKRAKVTHPLTDGQVIVVGTATLTAYHVPGHTAGSAVFRYGKTLFLGDNANGRDDGTIISAPWVVSDDTEENRRALRALVARLYESGTTVDALAFSHSGPMRGRALLRALAPPEDVAQGTSPGDAPGQGDTPPR